VYNAEVDSANASLALCDGIKNIPKITSAKDSKKEDQYMRTKNTNPEKNPHAKTTPSSSVCKSQAILQEGC
jgi:hypothetical protein